MATSAKFRIALTTAEFSRTYDALTAAGDHTLARKFLLYVKKADLGLLTPSHTAAPPLTQDQKLGFAEDSTAKELYELWKTQQDQGLRSNFNASQMLKIQDYRFTNSLMSEEEELEYGESLMSRAARG